VRKKRKKENEAEPLEEWKGSAAQRGEIPGTKKEKPPIDTWKSVHDKEQFLPLRRNAAMASI